MTKLLPANEDYVYFLYKRTLSAPVLQVTNKDNEVTTYEGAWYKDYSQFFVPASFINADNLPATFTYKVGSQTIKEFEVDLETSDAGSGGTDAEARIAALEARPVFNAGALEQVFANFEEVINSINGRLDSVEGQLADMT